MVASLASFFPCGAPRVRRRRHAGANHRARGGSNKCKKRAFRDKVNHFSLNRKPKCAEKHLTACDSLFLSSRAARVAAPARLTAVDCAPLSGESLPLFSESRGLSEKRRGLSTSYLPQCLFVSRIYANFDATSSHSCAHEIRFRLPLCFPTCRRDSLHARRICGPPRPSRRSPLRASLRALRQRRNRPAATSLRLGSSCARRAVSQRRRALHHAPRRGGHDHRRRFHNGRQFGGGRLLARRGGGHAHEH